MKIEYTTFSEAGKRRANQDVCRVIEIPERNSSLMVLCEKYSTDNYTGILAVIE